MINQILKLPSDWHSLGSISNDVLNTILHYTKNIDVEHSLETGAGKSTLLLSNISKHHLVFAIDKHNSISLVKYSPFFKKENVEFIVGPTQITLPQFKFDFKVQLALIDGPHGYPFPDLEYYYIYQVLDTGALLILDDIHIPSVKNMYKFIKKDQMFKLLTTRSKTAFFRRTNYPTFYSLGDGWWQ